MPGWPTTSPISNGRHSSIPPGYQTWNDQAYPWNQRGIELAAVVIQQGISGLPLPQALSEKTTIHVEGYQLLTGAPSPRYLAWLGTHDLAGAPSRWDAPQRPSFDM